MAAGDGGDLGFGGCGPSATLCVEEGPRHQRGRRALPGGGAGGVHSATLGGGVDPGAFKRAHRGAEFFLAGSARGRGFLFLFTKCNGASSLIFELLKNVFFSEPFYRRRNDFYFHRLTNVESSCIMDNILSTGDTMTQPTTQQHQRYHVNLEGRRTTISLDFWLAGLLAARLGVAPDDKKANGCVREWLQARTKEDGGGAGLNRRLIRQATIAIADNELSRRCATWLNVDGKTKSMAPEGTGDKRTKGRFALYQASAGGIPPDIIALGNTIEEVKMMGVERCNSLITDDHDWVAKMRTAILAATVGTKEIDRQGKYYIRQCSEKCWAELKNKKEFRPVVSDYNATWLTRKERAQMRKETAGAEWIRHIAGHPEAER